MMTMALTGGSKTGLPTLVAELLSSRQDMSI